MNNSYETFDLEMSGEKIKSLLDFLANNIDFLANNIDQLKTLIQENPDIKNNINQILSEINVIKNVTTIDGGEY